MTTICAMSAIFSLTFSSIFAEKLQIYPYFRNISTFYCRFMDDIFFLWNGTESELIDFLGNLNKNFPTLKLEFIYTKISITLSCSRKLIKTEMEYHALLSTENQVIAATFYTIIRHTQNL